MSARKKAGKYAVRINDFHREKGDISGRNRGCAAWMCMCTTFELSADRGEGEEGSRRKEIPRAEREADVGSRRGEASADKTVAVVQ